MDANKEMKAAASGDPSVRESEDKEEVKRPEKETALGKTRVAMAQRAADAADKRK